MIGAEEDIMDERMAGDQREIKGGDPKTISRISLLIETLR
jgi:hypothetical protein